MPSYKHTQIGYLLIFITFFVLIIFAVAQIAARAEPVSYDSGPNFAISALMVLILFVLASFSTLTVAICEQLLKISFGWGIYRKTFSLSDVASVRKVKNKWYYGWGIKLWLWPKKMRIYSVSGLNAFELTMNNGKVYRIGTDEPEKLEAAVQQAIHN